MKKFKLSIILLATLVGMLTLPIVSNADRQTNSVSNNTYDINQSVKQLNSTMSSQNDSYPHVKIVSYEVKNGKISQKQEDNLNKQLDKITKKHKHYHITQSLTGSESYGMMIVYTINYK